MEKIHRGIGLLELMLSLAIITILLVMVTRYFKPASLSQKVDSAVEMIQAIASAGQRWVLTNDTYNTNGNQVLNDFVARGYLPKSFLDPKNPWGGELSAQGQNTDSDHNGPYIKVEMNNIPEAACNNLKIECRNITCSSNDSKKEANYENCNGGTFTINIESICPNTL